MGKLFVVIDAPDTDSIAEITKKLNGVALDFDIIEKIPLESIERNDPWIGVDLDGTLAELDNRVSPFTIGDPIPLMIERVKAWLDQGITVKIFTARISDSWKEYVTTHYSKGVADRIEVVIVDWCIEHIGIQLPITNKKDYLMAQLWDDMTVRQVEMNTGIILKPGLLEWPQKTIRN